MRKLLEEPPTSDFRVPIVVEPKVGFFGLGNCGKCLDARRSCHQETWFASSGNVWQGGNTSDCDVRSPSDSPVANWTDGLSDEGVVQMAGLSKRGDIYYVVWRDAQGTVRRRSTGRKDKSAALQVKRQIERELMLDREDPFAKWRKTPLAQHAQDYRDYQLSVGTSQKQADQVHSRITRVLDAVGIRYITEMSVSRATTAIDRMRKVPQSPNRKPEMYPLLSLRTKNFYAKAIKQLTAWMVRERRLEHDPLLHLPMRKIDTDIRHDRRALTDEEFTNLVQAAEKSKKSVEGMTGPERSFLYKMARMTGLRRSELASLTAASFTLAGDPFVVVEAAYSKHRERDFVPLHEDLVPLVRERIALPYNGNPLFPLLEQRKTALMIRADLEVAGVPYQDDQGRYADFHALRHSFITGVWESGESPEVVMSLARHRSLTMTMRYTHVDRSAQVRAVKAMRSPLNGEDVKK
jgi:integrase